MTWRLALTREPLSPLAPCSSDSCDTPRPTGYNGTERGRELWAEFWAAEPHASFGNGTARSAATGVQFVAEAGDVAIWHGWTMVSSAHSCLSGVAQPQPDVREALPAASRRFSVTSHHVEYSGTKPYFAECLPQHMNSLNLSSAPRIALFGSFRNRAMHSPDAAVFADKPEYLDDYVPADAATRARELRYCIPESDDLWRFWAPQLQGSHSRL